MALHEVQLKGYSVRPSNLSLGTFDSYGIEQLHVTADDSWDGLDILAVFHAPDGTATKVVVGADGMLAVPSEATAKQAGVGRIVFVGLAENVQRITVDMGYNIKPHSDIEGDNPGTSTPDVVQQILANSNNAVSIATAAQDAAENARQAAEDAAKKAGEGAGGAAQSAAAAKKSAEDADNTANSIKDSMTQISENKEAVSQLKEDTAALKKRQNVLVGSETGNPVSCNDAYSAPLCGLTVYGKSTQDGTPTPDAPVPIVSAGDGGSVAVKVTGRNLLNIPDGSATARGVTVTAKDGLISISGTAISSGYAWSNIQPFITSGVVILSSSITSPKVKLVSETWAVVLTSGIADKMSNMATRIVFIVTEGQTYNLTGVKVQLELGTTATAYSPYREQLLTLPTPNGLPGIPVTSGGNYTDQNGQQWVCDEVDLERGVKVQRIDKTSFDNTKTLAEQSAILATPIETPLTPAEIAAYKAITAYAPDTVVQASDGAGIKLDYQRDVNLVVKNLEDAIASMTTT